MLQRFRIGFTLVELMVVIAVVAMLVALLLPAIQAARESARLTQCKNNLKQIGVAIHLHHDALSAMPPARLMPRPGDQDVCGVGTPTWMVRILPYLEENSFFEQWKLGERYDVHPEAVRTTTVASYFCPSRRDATSTVLHEDVTREFKVSTPPMHPNPRQWCPG